MIAGVALESVAQALAELAQRPDVDLAEDADLHHLALPGLERDLRLLDVVREGADAADGLVHVLERLHPVGARDELDRHRPPCLPRLGHHLLDALDAAYGLLDRQDDALLDLRRSGSGVAHANLDDVELEVREDLLLDGGGHPDPAAEEEQHEEVGRDGVPGHPRDGAGEVARVVGRARGVRPGVAHDWSSAASGPVCAFSMRSGASAATVARFVVTTNSPASRPLRR